MKRFCLALVLAAGLVAMLCPTADAARAKFKVNWLSVNSGTNAQPADSEFVSQTSAAWATSTPSDTTKPFRMPGPPARVTASATDSIGWFSFAFIPSPKNTGAGITAAADSIHLGTQVSWDAVNWTSVTPGQIYIPANTMPNTSSPPSIVLLEPGSANAFYHQYKFQYVALGLVGGPGEGATTAPTHLQMGVYPYVRFIVTGDWNGIYEGFVETYWYP